jgi:hypothetical protein
VDGGDDALGGSPHIVHQQWVVMRITTRQKMLDGRHRRKATAVQEPGHEWADVTSLSKCIDMCCGGDWCKFPMHLFE